MIHFQQTTIHKHNKELLMCLILTILTCMRMHLNQMFIPKIKQRA